VLIAYFRVGMTYPLRRWPWLYEGLGYPRYVVVMTFTLLLYGVVIKVFLRLLFGLKYVLVTPWLNV
jgi:hypothetical protein